MAWFRRAIPQAAAVPYRSGADGLEVLLITSRRTRRWIVPKGMVELNQTPREAAAQEAFEEAGVRGDVAGKRLGVYTYRKVDHPSGAVFAVQVFPLRVTSEADDWPERGQRRKQWLPVNAAARLVRESRLKKMLLTLPNALRLERE